jgi:hypothetical protein
MTINWLVVWESMDAWRADHPKANRRERSEALMSFVRANSREEDDEETARTVEPQPNT